MVLLLLMFAPRPATATFPGANGLIAFVRAGDIWTMWPDGSHQTRLTGNGFSSNPAWSADGGWIAFDRYSATTGGGIDVWAMRWDGSSKRRITKSAASDSNPAWSPSGHRIVFESTRGAVNGFESTLWTLHFPRSYGTAVRVTHDPNLPEWDFLGDRDPEWSPDGSLILFDRTMNSGGSQAGTDWHIATIRPSGSDLSVLDGLDRDGTWSPAGTRIASVYPTFDDEDLIDSQNIRHRTLAGTDAVVVTHYAAGSYLEVQSPSWSPDGRRIVYGLTTNFNPPSSVWVVRADGTRAPVRIATDASEPAWRPAPQA